MPHKNGDVGKFCKTLDYIECFENYGLPQYLHMGTMVKVRESLLCAATKANYFLQWHCMLESDINCEVQKYPKLLQFLGLLGWLLGSD